MQGTFQCGGDGRMRRGMAVALLLLVCVVVTGCTISGSIIIGDDDWSVTALSWQKRYWVPDEVWGRPDYAASPNYAWVVVDLTVRNDTGSPRIIDWSRDEIYLRLGSAIYRNTLCYSTPAGRLPTYYAPGETRSGYVFFEVPDFPDLRNMQMVVALRGGPDGQVCYLGSIPQI